jgi:hypothetical protein
LKTLNSPNEDGGDEFGDSLAINNDHIIVGAPRDYGSTDTIIEAGEVYVFKKDQGGVDNWGLIKTLNSPTPSAYDNFGSSVAIRGDYISILHQPLSTTGKISIYKKNQGGTNNWGLLKTIDSASIAANSSGNFDGVTMSGDYLIVSSLEDRGSSNDEFGKGEIYIFSKNEGGIDNWGLVYALNSNNEDYGDNFGSSVAMDLAYIVVGAWRDGGLSDLVYGTGEAYVINITDLSFLPKQLNKYIKINN